jgi:predicted phosphodiesterase/hypothetical membrane protein
MAEKIVSAGRPRLAVASALVPPIALIGGWTIAAAWQPAGYSQVRESISALAASATPHRWVMTTGLVLTGLGHLVTAYAVPRVARPGRVLLALGGLFAVLVALVPLPSRTDSSALHVAVATVSFVALAAWPLGAARAGGAQGVASADLGARPLTSADARGMPWPLRRSVRWAAVAVLGTLTALVGVATAAGWSRFGLVERLAAGAQAVWPLLVALGMWWAAGHQIARPRWHRFLLVIPLVAASVLGGTAMTTVWPTTAQTTHYKAQISFSMDPRDNGVIRAKTIFGDVRVGFDGLAPGIEAHPVVKANITDVLATGSTDLQSLQPSQAELDSAIASAARSLGLRFLLGGLLAALLVAAFEATFVPIWRRRMPPVLRLWRLLVPSAVAALAAAALVGVGVRQTYSTTHQVSFGTTGLIGVVEQNKDLLSGVEARAQEVTPYLRNLLALSGALQARYAPTASSDGDAALRLLLVSDVHDGNTYALMKTIVTEERIDAVIDAGDIVTFGRPEELDVAGIPAGIESLDVPYLFVRGNHDAASAGDQGVLERLAKVPNVVLLQPDATTYRELTINGVRIAGFNDPRYFGDSGKNTAEAQKPATAAFKATFQARDRLDIAVGHEPSAVRGLRLADLLVNGHMHVPALEGNRIQIGTFTGGGPFSHFLENASGEELVGQPSAFDIASFSGDCRLATLTRYTFHNVIEGRPAYDGVSLINGASIEAAPAKGAPERACGPGIGRQLVDVPAVSTATPQPSVSGTASGTGTG